MKVFRRWKTSIAASFESVLNQVENHEAIAIEVIREAQEAAARARVKLGHVQRDGADMRKRLANTEKAEAAWSSRALQVHEEDRDKALECIRRRNQARHDLETLKEEIAKHNELESRLRADLKVIDERIRELKQKKNAFAAREYRAKALKTSHADNDALVTELDNIFERWEIRLAEGEAFAGEPVDVLESEFASAEEKIELEAELEELVRESETDSKPES